MLAVAGQTIGPLVPKKVWNILKFHGQRQTLQLLPNSDKRRD